MNTIKTQDAKRWFTVATDPFHDYDVPLAGYPDSYSGETVVQLIKKKVTITKPFDLPEGETWDVHINTAPVLSSFRASWYTKQKKNSVSVPGNNPRAALLGTVNVTKVHAGEPTFPAANTEWEDGTIDQHRQVFAYSPTDDDNGEGMMRLIAGGFEVHNDTSPMFRNGNVTVYSQPQNPSTSFKFAGRLDASTEDIVLAGEVREHRGWPKYTSDAASLHDARSFTAEQGVLCPFRLNTEEDNSFRPSTTSLIEFRNHDDTRKFVQSYGYICNADYENSSGNIPKLATTGGDYDPSSGRFGADIGAVRTCNMDTVGAYFTGLSQETVLTLSMRFYVEIAPTSAHVKLISMASPSAPPDPKALWCYAHCIGRLPPGVPVDMNERGDWWRAVKKVLATAVPIVSDVAGLVTGQPEIAVIGNAAGSLLNATSKKKHPGKQKGTGAGNNTLRAPQKTVMTPRK